MLLLKLKIIFILCGSFDSKLFLEEEILGIAIADIDKLSLLS